MRDIRFIKSANVVVYCTYTAFRVSRDEMHLPKYKTRMDNFSFNSIHEHVANSSFVASDGDKFVEVANNIFAVSKDAGDVEYHGYHFGHLD